MKTWLTVAEGAAYSGVSRDTGRMTAASGNDDS